MRSSPVTNENAWQALRSHIEDYLEHPTERELEALEDHTLVALLTSRPSWADEILEPVPPASPPAASVGVSE